MKPIIFLIIVCIFSTGMSYHRADRINTTLLKNEVYGPNARNRMDVYLPLKRDSNTAVVILIHGGAWIVGNKNSFPDDIINGILNQGFAVSCINYRYARGDFHNQMQDIQLAVDYINARSGEWKISRGKFGMAGVSAGGHLALLFAHAYDSTHAVKAVVSLAGPTDLGDTLLHHYLQHYGLAFVLKKLSGTTVQHNPKVFADASPLFHCSPVPSLFINGKKDDLIPAEQAWRMFDTLIAKGIPADTIVLKNTGHYIYGRKNINNKQLIAEITSWMQTYLQ